MKENTTVMAASRRAGRALLACAAALSISCGSRSRGPVIDAPAALGGNVPVTTLSASELEDLPDLPVTQMIQIDGDASEQTGFTYIHAIARGDNGVIFTFDPQTGYISGHDSVGNRLHHFGGRGGGPGEINRPMLILSFGDTLLVADERGLNRFTTSGEYLGRAAIDLVHSDAKYGTVRTFIRALAWTVDGLVAATSNLRTSSKGPPAADTMMLHAIDGETARMGAAFITIPTSVQYNFGGAGRATAHFGTQTDYAVLADGRVLVTGNDGATLLVYRGGTLERRIDYGIPRMQVTNDDLDALYDERLAAWRIPLPNTEYPTRFAETMIREYRKLPHMRYHSIVGELLASPDGTVLMLRPDLSPGHKPYDHTPVATTWDLFDPNLKPVGRVRFPAGFVPLTVSSGVVVGKTLDENDTPSVSGYRFQAPARTRTYNSAAH